MTRGSKPCGPGRRRGPAWTRRALSRLACRALRDEPSAAGGGSGQSDSAPRAPLSPQRGKTRVRASQMHFQRRSSERHVRPHPNPLPQERESRRRPRRTATVRGAASGVRPSQPESQIFRPRCKPFSLSLGERAGVRASQLHSPRRRRSQKHVRPSSLIPRPTIDSSPRPSPRSRRRGSAGRSRPGIERSSSLFSSNPR